MKITAYNLRSIGQERTIDVSDKIVLCGANGAGKSTMAKVPYFVLTGKGLSLRNGVEEGYGQVEFGGMTIMRQKKKGGSVIRVNGKVCSEIAMREHLGKMGWDADALCALFDTNTTLDGETMLKVASMKLDVPKILSFTTLNDDDKKVLERYFAENDIELITIPIINKAYNRFYSARTEINREIKRLRTLVDNDAPFAKVQPIDIAQLVRDNAVLVQEREALARDIATAETTQRHIEKLSRNIKAWQNEKMVLEDAACPYGKTDVDAVEHEISVLRQKHAETATFIATTNAEILKLTNALTSLEADSRENETLLKHKTSTINTLANTKVCPLYAGVSCTTNMQVVIETLQNEVAVLTETIAEINGSKLNLLADIDNQKQLLAEAHDKLRDTESEIGKKQQQVRTMQDTIASFSATAGKIEEIAKNISKGQQEIASTTLCDIDDMNERLSVIKTNIKNIEQALIDAANISDAAKRLTQNQNALDAEEKKSATYSQIISALKMLPNRIFELVFKPIEQGINVILSEIKSDWQISFDFNGTGIDISIATPCGNICIDELSTGERIVVNYVFKVLICKLIRFDTILLDNTDALDIVNYNMVESVVERSPFNTLLINCGDVTSKFSIIRM